MTALTSPPTVRLLSRSRGDYRTNRTRCGRWPVDRSGDGELPGGVPDRPVHRARRALESLLGREPRGDVRALGAVAAVDGDVPAALGHPGLPGADVGAGLVHQVDRER